MMLVLINFIKQAIVMHVRKFFATHTVFTHAEFAEYMETGRGTGA